MVKYNNYSNTSALAAKMKEIKSQFAVTHPGFNPPNINSVTIETDGVNHINVGEQGMTELGQALSFKSALPFTHPEFGDFICVEALVQYLITGQKYEEYRTMLGGQAHTYTKKNKLATFDIGREFNRYVLEATYAKVAAYKEIQDELLKCDLPFDKYHVTEVERDEEGHRQYTITRPPSAGWFIPGVEEIRLALHEGREPDFSYFQYRRFKSKTSNPRSLDVLTEWCIENNARPLFRSEKKQKVNQNEPESIIEEDVLSESQEPVNTQETPEVEPTMIPIEAPFKLGINESGEVTIEGQELTHNTKYPGIVSTSIETQVTSSSNVQVDNGTDTRNVD